MEVNNLMQVVSKCGNICSSCPWGAWIRKNQSGEEWDSFAKDVKKYTGYTPTKNPCHGCQTPTENLSKHVGIHRYLRGCSIRKCALNNGIMNCAYCSRYPCDRIKMQNISNSRENAEKRIGESIPDDKYLAYIRVFEGRKTLDEIRKNLKPDQIQDVKTVDEKTSNVLAFPKINKKHQKYKKLHDLLSVILNFKFGLSDTDTTASHEIVTVNISIMMRILWILASYGTINGEVISVDSISIYIHKEGTSGFPHSEMAWKMWLDFLSKIGIKGKLKFVPIDKSKLTTPTGALREKIPGSNDPSYYLDVTFSKKLGGIDTIKLLQSYAIELESKYGKKAFFKFMKADMSYLQDKI